MSNRSRQQKKIYIVLEHFMLTGIVQKPKLRLFSVLLLSYRTKRQRMHYNGEHLQSLYLLLDRNTERTNPLASRCGNHLDMNISVP
jgi:hypothetical protein